MLESRDSAIRTNGTRYSDETKEVAYQLWAFATSRNASEVARRLSDEEWGSVQITKDTVAYWAREYGWAERATKDVQSIAPDLRHQAFSELLFAGLEGSKYIRQVITGTVPPDKTRVLASIAAVDRIGFSPIGKGMPAIDAPQTTTTRRTYTKEELAKMTPDELMRAELEYRSG